MGHTDTFRLFLGVGLSLQRRRVGGGWRETGQREFKRKSMKNQVRKWADGEVQIVTVAKQKVFN